MSLHYVQGRSGQRSFWIQRTNQINIPIKVQGVKRIFAFMKTASDIGSQPLQMWTDLFRYANATDVQQS